jgi:hypothetical protein
MTIEQTEAIRALEKVKIYYPGKAKTFIQAMRTKRKERPDSELSPQQWHFICDLVHTYRRQLPSDIHNKFCTDPKCKQKIQEQKALSRQLFLF